MADIEVAKRFIFTFTCKLAFMLEPNGVQDQIYVQLQMNAELLFSARQNELKYNYASI